MAEVKHYRALLYARHRDEALSRSEAAMRCTPLAEADALAFAAYSHRGQSIVLGLLSGPQTLASLNESLPPSDMDWTRLIVNWVVAEGLVAELLPRSELYGLTARGQAMLTALAEVPSSAKLEIWRAVWDPPSTDGQVTTG